MADSNKSSSKKIEVLWITNIPSPYRVDFFEGLGEKVVLTVLFEKSKSDERDDSWIQDSFNNFNAIILNGINIRTDSSFNFKIKKYLKKAEKYDYIVVSNPLTITGMYCIQYLKKHKLAFYIETDGGFPKEGNSFKERVKRYFIGSAQGWLSTAKIHEQYYLQYGADKEKIFKYPFTSVKAKDVLEKPVSNSEKIYLRTELGIKQEKMILSVGQFIHRKGFDFLLKIAANLNDNIAVVLLGGEATEEYLKIIEEKNLRNVYFPGFINKKDIQKYYRAADIFVLPTREDIWGLVINEAISAGLPVITTDRCIAGTELIVQKKNGFIVPVDDEEKFLEAIQMIIEDDLLLKSMSIESLKIAKQYTIEKMVEWHEKFFENR